MIQKDLSSSLSKFALHFGLDIETEHEQGARTCIYMLLKYYIFVASYRNVPDVTNN